MGYYAISIQNAMELIKTRQLVLPSFQREFCWSHEQIENLFDSIMRGYPINSFMFWEVGTQKIQGQYEFYEFISEYQEHFGEKNHCLAKNYLKLPFKAVIDGQQRLTAIYIGLYGTYRYRQKYKKHQNTERSMPTRKLYFDISKTMGANSGDLSEPSFRFLTKAEAEKKNSEGAEWFEVGLIGNPNLETIDDLRAFARNNGCSESAAGKLIELWRKINEEELINYYLEESQELNEVCDIFIRMNSGGTVLTKSNLLMSTLSENCSHVGFRQEIDKLQKELCGEAYGFYLSQDYFLKCLLVLSDMDVSFSLDNFGKDRVDKFERIWPNANEAIKATFLLLKSIGFTNDLLRSKNASIPIAYYIYKNGLSEKIAKSPNSYDRNDKDKILKYLIISLLNSIFGSSSDGALKKIRECISDNLFSNGFPIKEIAAAFSASRVGYRIDDDRINSLLQAKYKSPEADLVLRLLYKDVVYKNAADQIAKDHMHPKTIFTTEEKFRLIKFDDSQFAINPFYWNSVLNLQLLSNTENESKGDEDLKSWASKANMANKDLYLSPNASLDISDFKSFISDRKKNLSKKLKEIVSF